MKSNTLIFAAVCCVMLAGCGSRTGNSDGIVTVDFHDYIEKPLSELPDELYSSKRYVALHADDQNLMIGEIEKVVLRGDRIYVSEAFAGINGRQNLVAHDVEGYAVAKIGYKGRGPGEYLQITDFDVDTDGRVHLLDLTNGVKKIFIYAPDGKFIEEKPLPFSAEMIKCTSDGGYLMGLTPYDTSEWAGKRILKTDGSLNVINSAGEYDMERTDPNWAFDVRFGETPAGVTFNQPIDEYIYLLDTEGNFVKTTFLDLGGRAIPQDGRNNLEEIMMSENGKGYDYLIMSPVPYGKYIFGAMRQKGVPKTFIADTETRVFYSRIMTGPYYDHISNGHLISTSFVGDEESLPADLSAEMRTGVLSGDPLLVLYSLK